MRIRFHNVMTHEHLQMGEYNPMWISSYLGTTSLSNLTFKSKVESDMNFDSKQCNLLKNLKSLVANLTPLFERRDFLDVKLTHQPSKKKTRHFLLPRRNLCLMGGGSYVNNGKHVRISIHYLTEINTLSQISIHFSPYQYKFYTLYSARRLAFSFEDAQSNSFTQIK